MLAGPGAAADETKTRFYLLEIFHLKNGTQPGRMHEHFQEIMPLLNKHHTGPKLFLEALAAPHMPQVAAIFGFSSMEELATVHKRAGEDRELNQKQEAWDSAPEPPYEHQTNILLEAANYSPDIAPLKTPPAKPRVFELRTYHSPTWKQLKALHERFAGPEIRIFHRSGVHPLFYTSTIIGPNIPNLTYLIPFDSLAAREKAWDTFGSDPEWIKVRKESIDKHGQVSSVIQISLYRATPYSPVK